MVSEWSANGQWMVSEWSANGQWMVSEWSANGQWMVSEWSANGQWMVSECQLMVSEWSQISVNSCPLTKRSRLPCSVCIVSACADDGLGKVCQVQVVLKTWCHHGAWNAQNVGNKARKMGIQNIYDLWCLSWLKKYAVRPTTVRLKR